MVDNLEEGYRREVLFGKGKVEKLLGDWEMGYGRWEMSGSGFGSCVGVETHIGSSGRF